MFPSFTRETASLGRTYLFAKSRDFSPVSPVWKLHLEPFREVVSVHDQTPSGAQDPLHLPVEILYRVEPLHGRGTGHELSTSGRDRKLVKRSDPGNKIKLHSTWCTVEKGSRVCVAIRKCLHVEHDCKARFQIISQAAIAMTKSPRLGK